MPWALITLTLVGMFRMLTADSWLQFASGLGISFVATAWVYSIPLNAKAVAFIEEKEKGGKDAKGSVQDT